MTVLILSLICSLFIAIFAVQNASLVTIHFLWLTKEVPLVLVILGSAFGGALIMLFLAIWRELRAKLKSKQKLKEEAIFPSNQEDHIPLSKTSKTSDDATSRTHQDS